MARAMRLGVEAGRLAYEAGPHPAPALRQRVEPAGRPGELLSFPRPCLCLVTDRRAARGDLAAARRGGGRERRRPRPGARRASSTGRALLAHVRRAARRGAARRAARGGARARGREPPRRRRASQRAPTARTSASTPLPPAVARARCSARRPGSASRAHAPGRAARASPPRSLTYAHLAPIFAPLSKPAERVRPRPRRARRACAAPRSGARAGRHHAPPTPRACLRAGAAGVAVTGRDPARRPPPPRATAAALRKGTRSRS